MKFQHAMFDFHGHSNHHHPRKPQRHLVKAHRLPAPSRLSHLRSPCRYPGEALGHNMRQSLNNGTPLTTPNEVVHAII